MAGPDLHLFRLLNGTGPEGWRNLMWFLSEGNKLGPVRIGLLALALGLLWHRATRAATLLALAAWPVANGITEALKYGFGMPRPSHPEHGLADAVVLVDRLTSFGTASSHSANMMAVAAAFLLRGHRSGWAWFAVALLTGISRIHVGVHYPYQVFLGWICGFFAAFLLNETWKAFERLRAKKNENSPNSEAQRDDPTPTNV